MTSQSPESIIRQNNRSVEFIARAGGAGKKAFSGSALLALEVAPVLVASLTDYAVLEAFSEMVSALVTLEHTTDVKLTW